MAGPGKSGAILIFPGTWVQTSDTFVDAPISGKIPFGTEPLIYHKLMSVSSQTGSGFILNTDAQIFAQSAKLANRGKWTASFSSDTCQNDMAIAKK